MANEIEIKNFQTIFDEFQADLTSFGSQITNRQSGGAFDLLIRISVLMLSDAYKVIDKALDQGFVKTATGEFLDLKANEVGLVRLKATKTIKEFVLTRTDTAASLIIEVDDIIKSPVVPNRGVLRWLSIASDDPTVPAGKAGEFAIGVASITVRFEADDAGTAFNNMENLLGLDAGEVITMEIESGLAGVDLIQSTADQVDLVPGSDDETDEDLRTRILGRWSELAQAATRTSYINFAKNSSPRVFDANAIKDPGQGPTGVKVIVAGPPGNRALLLGLNISTNNFEPVYVVDKNNLPAAKSTGSHDGSSNNTKLVDSSATFITDGVVAGDVVRNNTDDSIMVVASNPTLETELLGTISGGIDNDWDSGDAYKVGKPVELGDTIHNFIRGKNPLTDFLTLEPVVEVKDPDVRATITLTVKVEDGFTEAIVEADLKKRIGALSVVETSVLDVKILNVGEDLLFSRLCKIVANTEGVADFNFTSPDPAVNNGDISIDDNEVLVVGPITINFV